MRKANTKQRVAAERVPRSCASAAARNRSAVPGSGRSTASGYSFGWLRTVALAALLLSAAARPAAAQLLRTDSAGPVAVAPLPPDRRSAVQPRPPNAARLRELRGQREFNYLEAKAQLSPWDLFWAKVLEKVFGWLNGRSYEHFWRWVFYALFIAAGAFVVLKLLQVDLTGAFGRGSRRARLDYATEGEDIHAPDLADRLAEAEAAGNYRLAVRLGYLQLLKHLTDGGLIDWQPDKTNQAYVRELADHATLQTSFREITRQFEYVWYGELPLTAGLYGQVRAGQQAGAAQLVTTPPAPLNLRVP